MCEGVKCEGVWSIFLGVCVLGTWKASSGCRDDLGVICSGIKCKLEEAGLQKTHLLLTPLSLSLSLSQQAMQLLTLLLSHAKSPEFSLSLTQLDPLPLRDDGLFARFHQQQGILRAADDADSLEREINRFIEVDQSLPITTRTPALQRLTEIIRGRRGDVTQLLTSESNSILRLIQVLVGVASSRVTTPTVAMEMGRCLGELGGVDLNCIALPPMVHNGERDLFIGKRAWQSKAVMKLVTFNM